MNETLKRFAKPFLIAAPLIWGSSFVVMKHTLDSMPVFHLLAFRFLVASAVLALLFWKSWKQADRNYLLQGAVLGLLLFGAYTAQTFGLAGTTPGKNAFLTAAYCIIVPFLHWLVSGKRPDGYNLAASLLCVGGIGLVSLTAAFTIARGDALTLLGGFFFAAHMVAVAQFSKDRDIFLLTVIQFAAGGLAALFCAPLFETAPAHLSGSAMASLLYLSLAATAGGLLFQNIGQKYTEPAAASVLLSLEAPFGVLFSMVFYRERLTLRIFSGFALIFLAVLCSETKFSFFKKFARGSGGEGLLLGKAALLPETNEAEK